MNTEYSIITPVRDEEEYIEKLIKSVLSQTLPPVKWVIINDGSTDHTEEIIRKYLPENPWIELVSLQDRGARKFGGDTVFNIGLQRVELDEIGYLARVDGDVSFDQNYFKKMIKIFRQTPRLGVASGEMVYPIDGSHKQVRGPNFQTHGPNKFYRVCCLQEIGGLDPELGWDIVDNVKAIYKGWEARRISDLHFIHYRRVGAKRGAWGIFINWGIAAYTSGYHPLFFLAKFVRRLATFPYIFGSLLMAYHYFNGFIQQRPQIVSSEIKHFIQNEQLKRLLGQPSVWS